MKSAGRAVVAVLLAIALASCLPPGGLPNTQTASTAEAADSVTVRVHNQNHLAVTVRLFSRGSQISRTRVRGAGSDTIHIDRGDLQVSQEIAAVLEIVGDRGTFRLPDEILPESASVVEIRVAELLTTSSMAIYQ